MIGSTKSIKVEEKKTVVRDDTLIQLFLPWLLESAENTRNGLFLARKDFRRLCGMRWHLSKTDCRRLLQVLQENETAKIPEQLHGFNFVLIDDVDGKRPIEMGWTKKEHRIKDPIIIKRLEKGENYGVRCGGTSPIVVDGQSYFLIVVDFDDEKIQTETLPKLPETFTTRSGGKGLYHLYFASDDDKSYSIKNENLDTLADVIGEGKQVIGPGSIHKKTGNKYEVVKDIPFAFIHYSELKAVLMPYDKSPKKEKHIAKAYVVQDDISSKILSAISMETVLNELGI